MIIEIPEIYLKVSVKKIEIYVLKAMLQEIHIDYGKNKLARDLIIETKKGHGIKGYATITTFEKKDTSRGVIIYFLGRKCGKSFNEIKGLRHIDKKTKTLKHNFFSK